MATPRAAEHRDLERRFSDLEKLVREVAGAVMRQRQLQVSQGDFVVSGGGSVVVQDGGNVTVDETGRFIAKYGDGTTGLTMGGFDGEADGVLVQLLEEDGASVVLQLFRQVGGSSGLTLRLDDCTILADLISLLGNVETSGNLTVSGTIMYPTPPTTGAAANVNWNSTNGNLRAVTSSLRYKLDPQDAPDGADAILSVSGRTWRDRAEVEADPDTDNRYVGFIAEELDAAGLREYVVYDDQGRPDAIQYDRLTVPLLQVAQRQQARIDDLEARLARLESRA